MNFFGYVEVFVKVELKGEEKPLYNRLKMDFSKPITESFFEELEKMMRNYYNTRFKKEVLSVKSVSEEEYDANDDKSEKRAVVSFVGDDIKYKEEIPSSQENFCYLVTYSFSDDARIVGPFDNEQKAFLVAKREAEEEYRIDSYENKKIASLSVYGNELKIDLNSKLHEYDDYETTTWKVFKMEEE